MACYLGIDTGGTFTDAVVCDSQSKAILASAKSLTTRFDLSIGIADAISRLPEAYLAQVTLVALSTTLTTNSVVEGRGSPVCVLLAGYNPAQIKNSGLQDLVGTASIVSLQGGHDAMGNEAMPLDLAAARDAILAQKGKVSAFALSATFAVRNPAHEVQLKQLVLSLCDLPVTCGHELASSLGAPRRALTVAMNARMISHVKDLIDAVGITLKQHAIDAPLMIVKGDGSLINVHSALQQPVTTVLSGPAASVMGACALAGLEGHGNAIVSDMGGTTTDIAVVRNGKPALSFDGALIGQWRPMVESIRVHAIGLGGDSELGYKGGDGFAIGPRRVIPMSLMVDQHPRFLTVLESQSRETPHASQLRFVQRLRADESVLRDLGEEEWQAWERLGEQPIDLEWANQHDRPLSKALARLERKGLAIYTGFTPTDAAHVLGASNHWSRPAAVLAARIWARQMRHLYGMGKWANGDEMGPSQFALDKVVEAACQKLIETGLNEFGRLSDAAAVKTAAVMTQIALHTEAKFTPPSADGTVVSSPAPESDLFRLNFSSGMPLIAVGAPAASIYPHVARSFGMQLKMPHHADVANAYGAVLGQVCQRVHVTIVQVQRGVFRVYLPEGPVNFESLAKATQAAQASASVRALELAQWAGTDSATLEFETDENAVENDIDGNLFFEARVTAIASGPPHTGIKAKAAALTTA
jgi:N-methylhydantoinase A/oxoprolinase/acetone carboxylase beta subunit